MLHSLIRESSENHSITNATQSKNSRVQNEYRIISFDGSIDVLVNAGSFKKLNNDHFSLRIIYNLH